jgi:hypothetical protein
MSVEELGPSWFCFTFGTNMLLSVCVYVFDVNVVVLLF